MGRVQTSQEKLQTRLDLTTLSNSHIDLVAATTRLIASYEDSNATEQGKD
jgi:hypothetical protein